MRTRPFGPSRAELPVIGQGTWELEQGDRAAAVRAMRRGIELGMTHLDTAEMYGTGRVEEIVGEAIRGLRDRVYVVSKVLPSNATYEGTLRACERSLKRLGTDRMDLYLLHWPGSHPLEETIRAFRRLRQDGRIAAFGVSNFDVAGMERAVAIAGAREIACNQVLYHLEERTIEHQVLDWCVRNDVAVVAYSPLAAKRFPSPDSEGGRVLSGIASARGATPRQVALAWLVRRAGIFAIPKSARADHVEENALAAEIELTPSEAERLESAFPLGPWRGLATA